MDTVDKETRSRIMASVGQKDTGAETMLRSALHATGLRYRLNDRKLPGSPDLVFPKYRAVIFVHGCYWHSHGCYKSTVPKSRREFWQDKFEANRKRDGRDVRRLHEHGWRILTVWECAIKGKTALESDSLVGAVAEWLHSDVSYQEIPAADPPRASEKA